jgi:hypothetical protein
MKVKELTDEQLAAQIKKKEAELKALYQESRKRSYKRKK